MRKFFNRIIPILVILIGTALLFYPYISEFLFEHRIDSEIATYEDTLADVDTQMYDQMLEDAIAYNKAMTESQVQLTDPFLGPTDQIGDIEYNNLLAIDKTGIMGYVEVPAISVYLPIYHGTETLTLERGIGHLEGTSLPVGGESTHSVLTGHTGLNKAKLFTDLTEVEVGDTFYIHVLGQTLAYQVYDISVVLPEDTSELMIYDNKDIVTLVTCTPYSVNTHRLLVHGKRIDYVEEEYEEAVEIGSKGTESQWMSSYKKAIFIGLLIAIILIIILLLIEKIKQKVDSDKK